MPVSLANSPDVTPFANSVLHVWILRILVDLNGHREFITYRGLHDDLLAIGLGFDHWLEPSPDGFNLKQAQAELRQHHQMAERKSEGASLPACLVKNVSKLADLLGLSSIDCRILEFAVCIHTERSLCDAADLLGELSSLKIFRAISTVLRLPEAEVRAALCPQGLLSRTGLVSIDPDSMGRFECKLDLLSDSFADLMASSEADPILLLSGTVSAAGPSTLKLSDYGHVQPSLDILKPYLRYSTEAKRSGVNIFLHGPPGTGKSQLARALADELGYELFEVASEDAGGNPVNGERRLRAFRAAQNFFTRRKTLIAFDEVEDVFNDGDIFFGKKSTAQLRKAWINRMLEENPVPTLWLSNSISDLDQAFIRRFDMVIELPVPSRQQRERIIRECCADLLNAGSISKVAEVEYLAPAVVTKAASVVRCISEHLGEEGSVVAFEQLVSSTLDAQGHRHNIKENSNRLPELYDPAFIHADANLSEIAASLSAEKAGRICLYGPPGTGKTAYGRWLALQLGAPLLVKRASDLMSPYVGESEQNIARAFREAHKDQAILLIDEVDSFLQERQSAQRGWEVSMVNEMLTQMESFSGVFVASTNLMQGIDQAALRRFDLKVKFDFLRPSQACELLKRYCDSLDLSAPDSNLLTRVERLHNLTPGDFATVFRQHRFRPIKSASALVMALEAESMMKCGARKSIGFIQDTA